MCCENCSTILGWSVDIYAVVHFMLALMIIHNERIVFLLLSPLQGISFEEFRSFFQFLNHLEDFTIAMQMYNFAHRPVGQGNVSDC